MEKVLKFLKKHVKVTLGIAALGVAVTLGWSADGCSVDAAPDTAAPAVVEGGDASAAE